MKKCILFFAVTAFMAAGNGCAGSGDRKKTPEVGKEEKSQQKDEHATLKVSGSCGMCKTRIEKAAKAVDGVTVAGWDNGSQELHLHFDPAKTSVDAVSRAIAAAGHDTGKDRADDRVYDALPECCKYRN
jgi:Cu(I)/Ag(I) efflux system membrane fusion protein